MGDCIAEAIPKFDRMNGRRGQLNGQTSVLVNGRINGYSSERKT